MVTQSNHLYFFSSCSDNSCIAGDRSKDDDSPTDISAPTSSKLLQLYQRRNQQIRASENRGSETRGSIAKDFSAEILREIYGTSKPEATVIRADTEAPVATMQIPRASGKGLSINDNMQFLTFLPHRHRFYC